jgi:nondiscriminating aspartyl-tRNA synthetase
MSEYALTTEAPLRLRELIEIRGHVQAIRKLGNLAFIVVRDRAGVIQTVVEEADLLAVVQQLTPEMAIAVRGEVMPNPVGSTGAVELKAKELLMLGAPSVVLPVEIAKNQKVDSLSLPALLDYRPLTLRNEKVRAIFKIQAALCTGFRAYLATQGFTEIHSPKLVATGTEGGAQLFSLDYFGKRAYLAQSPQFYKQMMVGVFERVFEIGPVYRAEEHDTTRHLNEYISMDVEMGFIQDEQDLMLLEKRLLQDMFSYAGLLCEAELALYDVKMPALEVLPQITLADALLLLQSQYNWKAGDSTPDLDPEGERLLSEHFLKKENSEFVFVTRYPHAVRPFYTMPEQSTSSRSFDLLFRGLEVTTGGQRIHEHKQLCDSISQRGLKPEQFADYLQCFAYGMPPHGGFAIGLERLTKQLLGLPNVKQASLFPRDRNRITP